MAARLLVRIFSTVSCITENFNQASVMKLIVSILRYALLSFCESWSIFALTLGPAWFLLVMSSRKAIGGAIIGLLLVCYDLCYDHMASQSLEICFLFSLSCIFNRVACVTSF